MAGQRLTDKSASNSNTGTGDLYMIVDVSDTTGSAEGTSKKLDSKYVIQTDKISVSAAETQSLKTVPKTLVSAAGSGYAIIPLAFTVFTTYSSTENAKITLLFGHTGGSSASLSCGYIASFMKGVTANATYIVSNLGGISATPTIDNVPLYLSSTENFAGGFTMDVYVTYQIIKLS
tara:strand:- start:240 stop:767 length:528 start_codon:yes stop_codon:yes gene_type:complete